MKPLLPLLLLLLLLAVATPCDSPPPIARPIVNVAAIQSQSFINITGPDLKSRLDAAIKQGSTQQKRFWAAYMFDVRPGIAFDMVIISSGGSRITINGAMVNTKYQTGNVGIFLLYEKDGRSVVRAEIYNLDRNREYAGYPVYWLGHANNEESLNFLQGLVGTIRSSEAADHITDAIGAHDDPRAAEILKNVILTSTVEKVRTNAISWLGQLPGETTFLATLVRNERERVEVRKEAADAISENPDGEVIPVLEDLYRSVTHREVKKEIMGAISNSKPEEATVNFLIEVARQEKDRELRKEAIELLGEKKDSRSLQALEKVINDAGAGNELQKTAVEAISQRPEDEALPLLKKIAKTHTRIELRKEAIEHLSEFPDQIPLLIELARDNSENVELRRQAIEAIAESEKEEAGSMLRQLYPSITNRELKQEIISAFQSCEDKKSAIDFLTEIAQKDSDPKAREQAFSTLSGMDDDLAVDALVHLYDIERSEKVKVEILSALSESNSKRAVKKLMEVAKRDASLQLRKEAISLLGESDDPEAQKFIEDILK
ncbi:MAG: HEAT repeat domain-containing protein [Acidobacteriota bacterium]